MVTKRQNVIENFSSDLATLWAPFS